MSRMTLYPYAIDKMHARKGTAVVYRFKRKLTVVPLIAPLVTGVSADDMSHDIPPLKIDSRCESESTSEHHSPTDKSTAASASAAAAAAAASADTATSVSTVVSHSASTTDDSGGADVTFDEVDGRKRIQSGTLRGLVRALADQDVQDKDYLDVFVMTYHYFTTGPELLDELAARFDLQPPAGQAADDAAFVRSKNFVQMRVINVLKKWIQCNFADIAASQATRDALAVALARMAATAGDGGRGMARHAAQMYDELWCEHCEKRGLSTPLESILANELGSPRSAAAAVSRPRPAVVDVAANASRPSNQAPPSPRARRNTPGSPAPLSPRVGARPAGPAPSTPTTPSSPRTLRPTGVAPPSPRAGESAAGSSGGSGGAGERASGNSSGSNSSSVVTDGSASPGSPTTRRKRRSNITTSTGASLNRSSPKGSPLISRSDFSVVRSIRLADSDEADTDDTPAATPALTERRDSRHDGLDRRASDAAQTDVSESSMSESRRDEESSEAAATAATAVNGSGVADDMGARCSIDDFTAMQLAHQMTLDEFRIFARIDPVRELGLKTWEKRPDDAPNIIALIERINDISWWTATEVIMKPTLKLRTDVVVKMIDVAQLLFELNNFNGLMEVTSGLNLSVVSRLKQLWENVPKKKVEQLRTLTEIMSPIGGYATYRRELAKADGQAGGAIVSAIPFQGVYLSNLTAIEENPNVLANGHINFAKMWMLGRIFRSIVAFQRIPYDQLHADATVAKFFRTIAKLNDDELWQLSLKLQPRNSAADEPSPAKDSLAKRLLTTRPRRNSLLGKKNKSDLATQLADIEQSNEDEGVKELRKQMAMRDTPTSRFVRTVSSSGRTRSNSVNASLERAHSTSHT
jgi:hypothetical protein